MVCGTGQYIGLLTCTLQDPLSSISSVVLDSDQLSCSRIYGNSPHQGSDVLLLTSPRDILRSWLPSLVYMERIKSHVRIVEIKDDRIAEYIFQANENRQTQHQIYLNHKI